MMVPQPKYPFRRYRSTVLLNWLNRYHYARAVMFDYSEDCQKLGNWSDYDCAYGTAVHYGSKAGEIITILRSRHFKIAYDSSALEYVTA